MAKKNDSTEQQTVGALQDTAEANTAPAETAPLVNVGENTNGTVPLTPDSTNTVLPDAVGTATPDLFTLDALADKHRVASWQQAALVRLTGWVAGKEVSEADYTAALNNLQYRRMGSGRA